MLEHDSDGFLLADRTAIDDSENYLEQISDDIAEIKRLLTGMNSLSTNQATNNQESPLAEPTVINSETIRDNTERRISESNQQTTSDITVDVQIAPIDINLSGQSTSEQARQRDYRRDQSGRFISNDDVIAEPVINNSVNSASINDSSVNIDNQPAQINAESTNSQTNNSETNRTALINRARDAQGRFISNDDVIAEPVINNIRAESQRDSANSQASLQQNPQPLPPSVNNQQEQRLRDANGRFTNNQTGTGGRERDSRGRFVSGQTPSERQQERNLFSRLINVFSSRNQSINTDFQEVDPTIKAYNELKELAQPLTNVVTGIGSVGKFALDNAAAQQPTNEHSHRRSSDSSETTNRSRNTINNPSAPPTQAVNDGQSSVNGGEQATIQQNNNALNANTSTQASNTSIPVVIDSSNLIEPIVHINEQTTQQTTLLKRLFNDFKLFRNQGGTYKKIAETAHANRAKPLHPSNSSGFLAKLFGKKQESRDVFEQQLANLQEINSDSDKGINHLKAIDVAMNGTFLGKLVGGLFKLVLLPITMPIAIAKAISKSQDKKREETAINRMRRDVHGIWAHTKQMRLDLIAIRKKLKGDSELADTSDDNGGGWLSSLISIGAIILTALAGIGTAIVTGIVGLVTLALPIIGAALSGLAALVMPVLMAIGSAILPAISAALGIIFSPIGLAIAAAAALAWGLFTEEGRAFFASVGGFIQEKFGQAIDWFAETFPETTQFIKDTWGNAVQLFDDAANYAQSVWDWLKEKFTPIIDSATELWTWLKDKWDSTLALVSNVFDGIADFIKNKFGFDIKAQAQKLLESAKKTVEKVVESGTNLVKLVIEKNNELWQSIKETVSNLIETAKTGIDNTKQAMDRAYNVVEAKTGSALEAVMPKGYRHKALFDGIKGGDALNKYGSYTDEEAERIRHLKSNHANTSANLNGGMPLDVQDKIAGQAKKYGLDPVMMQKIAAMESGGNADAISSTGAIGVYQFTGKTASGVGIKNRFDVNQNIEGGMKLAKANVEKLKSKGLPVTAENVYMMHQLGEGAAPEVIKAALNGKSKSELSSSTQSAMNLNFGANSKTAADYIETNKKALDDRYKKVVSHSMATLSNQKINTSVANSQQANTLSELAPTTQNALAQKQSLSNVLALSPQTISLSSAPFVSGISQAKQVTTPKIPDAPPITIPLASNNDTTNTQTIMQYGDVGQDVSDRSIAHIITGGIAKGG